MKELPGLPFSISGGFVKNKHALYTGPEFFRHYYGREDQRSFGWNLGYNFSPDPQNKYFQLYFNLFANWYKTRYQITSSGVLYNGSTYTNVTKLKLNGFSFMAGYGFVVRYRNLGFLFHVMGGAYTEDWIIKSFDGNNVQLGSTYHQKIGTDIMFSYGGVGGIFFDIHFK